MTLVLLAVGAFLLGGFPTGLLLARARGIDLRTIGSGNIGATNVGRALGKKAAVFVLVVDALKGYAPAAIAATFDPLGGPVAGLAAVLGHVFSVFLKGRGGKGVATSLGAALAVAPEAAGIAVVVWIALFAIFRTSSVGSLGAVVAFPVLVWLSGPADPARLAFAVGIAVVVVARHHDNIRRLIRGEELKV